MKSPTSDLRIRQPSMRSQKHAGRIVSAAAIVPIRKTMARWIEFCGKSRLLMMELTQSRDHSDDASGLCGRERASKKRKLVLTSHEFYDPGPMFEQQKFKAICHPIMEAHRTDALKFQLGEFMDEPTSLCYVDYGCCPRFDQNRSGRCAQLAPGETEL